MNHQGPVTDCWKHRESFLRSWQSEGLFSFFWANITGYYAKPDKCNRNFQTYSFKIRLILFCHLHLSLLSCVLAQGCPCTFCTEVCPLPCALRAHETYPPWFSVMRRDRDTNISREDTASIFSYDKGQGYQYFEGEYCFHFQLW